MSILVALDNSEFAPRVLAHAQALAERAGAPLRLLRVMNPRTDVPGGAEPGAEITASVRADWEATLTEMLTRLGARGEAVTEVLRPHERVHDAVVRAAEAHDASLIAVGSHGAGFLRHTVLGSVAMGVVGKAPVPVFIAGPRAEAQPRLEGPYTILVPNDLGGERRALIDGLLPLAGSEQVQIRLLYLYEERLGDRGEAAELKAARETLASLAQGFPDPARVAIDAQRLRDFERADGGILRVARETGASAIAMATHGHSRGRHLLGGSKAVGVLKNAGIPVVLARYERG